MPKQTKMSDKNSEVRRNQILAKTLNLIKIHGANVSTAQIAKESRCSKETLYTWFGNRDGIFETLADELTKKINEALTKTQQTNQGAEFTKKLEAMSLAWLDIISGDAVIAVSRAVMSQVGDKPNNASKIFEQQWDRTKIPFFELFEEGTKSKIVKIKDKQEAFDTLAGLVAGERLYRQLLGQNTRMNMSEMKSHTKKTVKQWITLYK